MRLLPLAACLLAGAIPAAGAEFPRFEHKVIDPAIGKVCYAVTVADVDGDGDDDIVVGHSDPSDGPVKGPALYVFECLDAAAGKWEKHLIDDGGVAVEDLICADLTGDGRIDILAGGRQTGNLMLYINRNPESDTAMTAAMQQAPTAGGQLSAGQ